MVNYRVKKRVIFCLTLQQIHEQQNVAYYPLVKKTLFKDNCMARHTQSGLKMIIKSYFQEFHYKKEYNFMEKILSGVLAPVSFLYGLAVSFRIFLYELACLPSWSAGVPVISIGNITTGGTGKTPVVMALASHLTECCGYKVAILTRGYGRKTRARYVVVRDYKKIYSQSPVDCGDEPYMMAKELKNVVILAGSRRAELARVAVDKFHADILLLDDGYQHLALQRDYNVLVINGINHTGNSCLLPAGPLREPIGAIKRADLIINVSKNPSEKPMMPPEWQAFQKPVLEAQYTFESFLNLKTGEKTTSIKQKNVLAFCGIGQPEGFFNQLEGLGLNLKYKAPCIDHKAYNQQDIEQFNAQAKATSAEAFVTTQKDSAKIRPFLNCFQGPVYAIKMSMTFDMPYLLNLAGIYVKNTR